MHYSRIVLLLLAAASASAGAIHARQVADLPAPSLPDLSTLSLSSIPIPTIPGCSFQGKLSSSQSLTRACPDSQPDCFEALQGIPSLFEQCGAASLNFNSTTLETTQQVCLQAFLGVTTGITPVSYKTFEEEYE
jgi:hypothetical protein